MSFLRYIIFVIAATVSLNVVARESRPSILLYNETEGRAFIEQNTDAVRPFASITKLMTAMVSLDYSKDMNRIVKTSTSRLPYDAYPIGDIFTAMLVRSDNGAAEAIAKEYPGGRKAFIEAMNAKAKALGMNDTHYADESGLNKKNTSTAKDLRLMLVAASKYEMIRKTSIQKEVIFESYYKKKVRKVVIDNTNKPVLFEFDNIVVTKTGFTNPAGWCVALAVEQKGQVYTVIILGAKNKLLRFDTVKEIMNHYILNYHPREDQPVFLFPL